MQMDHGPFLNYDILHLVMSLSSTQEISRMMQTCQLLHREGTKILLREAIVLRRESDVVSFIAFMCADNYRRFLNLLDLHFFCKRLSPTAGLLLRHFFLTTASRMHFRCLQLDDVEDVLASDSELPSALGRIMAISNLILSDVGPLARAMLDGMTTHVYHISINFPDDPSEDLEDSNALVVLKSLRPSLMSISGRWLETTPELPFYDIKYPHVHALTMDTFDVVHIAHYAYSCPHVTSLTLESTASMDSVVQMEMCREENRRAQLEHAKWDALVDYQGSVVDLWALGLVCHVERLQFTRDGWDSGMFKDVLLDVRPIAIRMAVGVQVMADPMFVDALCQSTARDLRIEIIFDEADRDKDVSVTLVSARNGSRFPVPGSVSRNRILSPGHTRRVCERCSASVPCYPHRLSGPPRPNGFTRVRR